MVSSLKEYGKRDNPVCATEEGGMEASPQTLKLSHPEKYVFSIAI